jgi:transcriptional regulator with XRE-family HTH domain
MERLKGIRAARGFSQRDLAKAAGIAQNTISAIERGNRPAQPSTLRKLADGLDVSVDSLLTEDGIANKDIEERMTELEEQLAHLKETLRAV